MKEGVYSVSMLPFKDRFEAAVIGRSNCGKSSLINALCGVYGAKVSSKPGHTKCLGVHNLGKIRLIDLPGYGYGKMNKTRKAIINDMVWDYFDSNRPNMVLLLIDSRRGVLSIDEIIMEEVGKRGIPIRVIGTKIDKREAVKEGMDMYCSTHSREGIDEIKEFLKQMEYA